MTIIRLLDKVYWLYCKLVSIHKKSFAQLSLEIIIIVLLFACYVPRDTQYSILKSEIVTVKKTNDTINYLLKMVRIKDSINITQLRHRPSLQPIRGQDIVAISTTYGMKTNVKYGMVRFHNGIDFAAKRGTPVYSAGDGIIIDSGSDNGYGNHIEIDHKNGYVTFYGHLDTRKVITEQEVLRGDTIGTVGSTGISTGYHLHYKITYKGKSINPNIFQ